MIWIYSPHPDKSHRSSTAFALTAECGLLGKSFKTAIGFSIHQEQREGSFQPGHSFSSLAVLALVLQDAGTKKRAIAPGISFYFRGKACERKIRREHERLRAGQMEIKSDPALEARREGWVGG